MIRKIAITALAIVASVLAAAVPALAGTASRANPPPIYYHGGHLTGRSVTALPLAPNVYSSYKSGYVAHGNDRVFQRVTASFPAAHTSTLHGTTSWREYVQLSTGGHQFDAGILAVAADTYAAEYRIDGAAAVMTFTPQIQPGDRLTATVSYDVHGDQALDFTVTDHTTGASVTVPDVVKPPSGKITYAGVFTHPNYPSPSCSGINPVATDCLNNRLGAYSLIAFTANNGAVGNLTHKFLVAREVQTDTGDADGHLYSSPNNPWNNGANFGDYMRP
jgi:hypothetical protein